GERADWMVEKLSELGAAAWLPLITARGVVLPEGKNKRERWARIASESAKQCRRRGILRIAELTPLSQAARIVTDTGGTAWCLSLADDAAPVATVLADARPARLTVFVGPEGGWTAGEADEMRAAAI